VFHFIISVSDAIAAFPALTRVGIMSDKVEITAVASLTKRFGALEIRKW
jgi:hypothetical protein